MNNKLLIVCGLTATGKTKLGIKLARKFNGEIVSADSRQVYRYMNIGTGKDVSGIFNFQFSIFNKFSNSKFQIGYYEVDRVKVWLLDIVEPDWRFNVADYKNCAEAVVGDIQKRGKLPIIVGGTGFYIRAITERIETLGVEPDWELRKKLSNCQIDELRIILERMDSERFQRMNESDRKNPRRLIRVIEIARWKLEVRDGKLDREMGSEKNGSHISHQDPASHFQPPTSILLIGLAAPNNVLYQRIDRRVEERVKAGIEDEIRGLLDKGYNWENSALGSTIAYREWEEYFDISVGAQHVAPAMSEIKNKTIQRWKFDEHSYSRRQMTWFKKNPQINWFDISKEGYQEEVEKLVKDWYSELV